MYSYLTVLFTGMGCYLAASLQGIIAGRLDQQLDPAAPRDAIHQALDITLVQVCQAVRTPGTGPVDPTPVMDRLNDCLRDSEQPLYDVSVGWEAAEWLQHLLSHLALLPNTIIHHRQQGVCQICNVPVHQPYQYGWNVVPLVIPRQGQPVSLPVLLADTVANPPMADPLLCQTPGVCGGQPVQATLVPQPGQLLILYAPRMQVGGGGQKILTPIEEPQGSEPGWPPGLRATVVLAHSNRGAGHWFTFVRRGNQWWRLDSARHAPTLENPWVRQQGVVTARGEYTINIVFFE